MTARMRVRCIDAESDLNEPASMKLARGSNISSTFIRQNCQIKPQFVENFKLFCGETSNVDSFYLLVCNLVERSLVRLLLGNKFANCISTVARVNPDQVGNRDAGVLSTA